MFQFSLNWIAAISALQLFSSIPVAQAFVDPEPPRLAILPDIPQSEPIAFERLRFHAAPKPLARGAITHDWRDFLGPTHNAVSTETPLVKQFGKTGPPIVWEVSKGEGFASPAVVGERLILFHRLANEEIVECLHTETGKRYWKFTYPCSYDDRFGFNGGPRCQPISDGQFVYLFGVEGKLHCIKLMTGQIVWKRDILKEFKLSQNYFGVGSTPLLEGDLVIVNVGAEAGPCVAAFDKRTGKLVWGAGKEWTPGYASPIPATVNGKRRVFVFTGGDSRPTNGGVLCIDPANGRVDFSLPWRSRSYFSANASPPVVVGNQVFISECYGPGAVLLDILPGGTLRQVWNNQILRTHYMTAVHKDGYLYGIDGHGPTNAPIVCIELKTGKEMWRKEPEWEDVVKTPTGSVRTNRAPALASLLLVDGRCLVLGEYGHLAWLDLNPKEYRELDRKLLFFADQTWSMPVLSHGLVYVCQNERGIDGTGTRLICYDLRGETVK